MDDRRDGLLAWQLGLYPDGHRHRRNLLIHALTVPVFWSGTATMVAAPLLDPWLGLLGLAFIVLTVFAQGRGHRLEATRPVPFRGPFDVAARLFVEQWITFPRFVLSGGFGRAWRGET